MRRGAAIALPLFRRLDGARRAENDCPGLPDAFRRFNSIQDGVEIGACSLLDSHLCGVGQCWLKNSTDLSPMLDLLRRRAMGHRSCLFGAGGQFIANADRFTHPLKSVAFYHKGKGKPRNDSRERPHRRLWFKSGANRGTGPNGTGLSEMGGCGPQRNASFWNPPVGTLRRATPGRGVRVGCRCNLRRTGHRTVPTPRRARYLRNAGWTSIHGLNPVHWCRKLTAKRSRRRGVTGLGQPPRKSRGRRSSSASE